MIMAARPNVQAQINLPQQPQYEITEEDKKRVKKINMAWRAYNGDLDEPLQKMPGAPNDNVMTNRLQAVVDRGIDFLFGKELEISIDDNAPEEAQAFLDKTWGRKETRIPLLQKLAMNGAIAGEAFLRIMPEPNGTYRLIVVDPSTVFTQSAAQDCETVLLYCIEYCTDQTINGHAEHVYYREEISRNDPDNDGDDGNPFADVDATWTVQHWSRVGDRGAWTPAGEPIDWPYTFPPIFQCQNLPRPNDLWGIPDITPDLIGVNNSLNLVQSNVNRIQKLFGSPVLYANGMGEGVIDIKPGKIIRLPAVDSKITAVALASDTSNALAFAANLRSDIDEQSSVPGVATGRIADLPHGTMSGIAIELLFMPLIKKTDKKRCLYGSIIIDICQALLILNGMSPDIEVTLAWQNALPSDDLPSVQSAIAKKELSISNTTLMRELGYDPEEELELSQTEDAKLLQGFNRGAGMPPVMLPPADPGTKPLPGQLPAAPPTSGNGGGSVDATH
jgi:hypothetical protein